jgi:hypothetical protein
MSDATTTPRHGKVKETLSPEEWQQHIAATLDGFNFEKVHRAMKAVGWEWWPQPTGMPKVPTPDELRTCASRLIDFMVQHRQDGDSTEFGGFRVTKYDDGLRLEFVFEQVYSEEVV